MAWCCAVDPLDLFVHQFARRVTASSSGQEVDSTVEITVEGYKAENGQQLNSTGEW
jgi:hypothetical protein